LSACPVLLLPVHVVSILTAGTAHTIKGAGVHMAIEPIELHRAGRDEISPVGRATELLTKNLQESLQEWLRRPTMALMLLQMRESK